MILKNFISMCRNRMAASIPYSSGNSSCSAEIIFIPSFECHGKTAYCRIFTCNGQMNIGYMHFKKYDFSLLNYTEISAEFVDNIFTDSYCGIVTVSNASADKIEILISQIQNLDFLCKSTPHIDGFSHIVLSGERTFYWNDADISPAADLLNSFVHKVFSLLPPELRTVDFQPDIS